MGDLLTNFRAARSAGTTLVDIRTPDATATIRALLPALKNTALLRLDLGGLSGLNRKGNAVAKTFGGHSENSLLEYLGSLIEHPPRNAVVFLENAQMFWGEPAIEQAVWSAHEAWNATSSTIVLLTSPGSILPPILARNVLVFDEPIPLVV